MAIKSEMERRVKAAQATKDAWEGKPFKPGRFDCALMTDAHLVRMGRPVKVRRRAGMYKSIKGAKKALERIGHPNLASLMDAHFKRVPWAAARPGDIIQMPSAGDLDDIGALAIAMGNGRALLYHQDHQGVVVAEVVEAVTAWRVIGN